MVRRMFPGLLWRFLLIVPFLGQAAWAAGGLPPARDLAVDGQWATTQHGAVIILFSRADCGYCERVRREYLLPLERDARYQGRVRIRQINQDSEMAVLDFEGKPTTHSRFARRHQVRMVPVVAFFGAGGKPGAAPMVGLRLPDFYQSYLESSLNETLKD